MIRRRLEGWQSRGDASHVIVSGFSSDNPLLSLGFYTADIKGPVAGHALKQIDPEVFRGSNQSMYTVGVSGYNDVTFCVINLTEPA